MQQREEQTTWQNHRAGNWQSDHRSWQQRGGYNGYRVPDARYGVYFGQQHVFRIYGLPFMVFDGYPRFQYNGYWITLLDPWPGNWSNDWYDTDNVYVRLRERRLLPVRRQVSGHRNCGQHLDVKTLSARRSCSSKAGDPLS